MTCVCNAIVVDFRYSGPDDGRDDYTNARLAWSANLGVNWTWADWYFSETFACPAFVQFGKNYEGARDGYVYVVSPVGG